jgi:hypothetical protein
MKLLVLLLTLPMTAFCQCYTLINVTNHPVTLNYGLENGGPTGPPWVSGQTLPVGGQVKYCATLFNVVGSIATPNTIVEGNRRLIMGPHNGLPGGTYKLVSNESGHDGRGGGERRGGEEGRGSGPQRPPENNCLNFQGNWYAERQFTALQLTQKGCEITGFSQEKNGTIDYTVTGAANSDSARLTLAGHGAGCSNTMHGIISPRENQRLAFQVNDSSGGCGYDSEGTSPIQILRWILPNGDLVK